MRGRLRESVRRLRGMPVVGGAVRAADRLWWARTISRSSLVDPVFYAAQLGLRRLPRTLAIAHYVAHGFRRGMSLNPLFDDVCAGGELPEVLRVPALYAYLLSERETVRVHPWWDAVEHGRRVGGPGLEAVWADRRSTIAMTAAGYRRSLTVSEARALALSAARTWHRQHVEGDVTPRAARLGIVRPIQAHDRRYARKIEQVAGRSDDARVVSLVGVDASQWVSAHLLAAIVPDVTLQGRRAPAVWSAVVADAVAALSVETVVVLDPRSEFTDGEISALATSAAEGAAAIPAHRSQDGTVDGLGAADIGGRRPWKVLQSHPVEDLEALDEVLPVPLLSGRTVAAPAAELRRAATEGCVSSATDLSRALSDSLPLLVHTRIRPVLDEPQLAFRLTRDGRPPRRDSDRAFVVATIERAGFDLVSWRESGHRVTPVLRWRTPSPGSQRWAIKICAPAGRQGSVWGDAHFARGLASALRRRGHTVVIDAYDARNRATSYLDDVNVAVRGPYRIDSLSTGVNLQWIISHPDQITRDEVVAFDRVFAASDTWSRAASARWGVRVDPLLECTDTDLFRPTGVDRTDDIVFVGTARGIPRPSVVGPLRAGIPVRVYGPDWRPFISQSAIAARSIPHDRLAERYESASIVLNDQWPAMRQNGFLAMRPFDVVAVGGRVISEEVEGIHDIFRGAVVTYRDTDHLIELLRADPDSVFPDRQTLAREAERIRREHSFDARAAVLEEAVRSVSSPRLRMLSEDAR